jgi:hypothetical protein
MNMTLKELGALLRRELAKWLGVGVHGLGVQWRGIVTLSQGRRSAGEDARRPLRHKRQRPRVPFAVCPHSICPRAHPISDIRPVPLLFSVPHLRLAGLNSGLENPQLGT